MKYPPPRAPEDPTATAAQPVAAYRQAVCRDIPDWIGAATLAALERLDRARQDARHSDERAAAGAVWAALQAHRHDWTAQLVQALMQSLDRDLADAASDRPHDAAGADSTLSLLADDAVDEDIALSRLVQAAESGAEAALRELAARCSRMRGLGSVQADANPMRPAVVAGALRQAVERFGLPAPQRVVLLRELGSAIGSCLAAVYARHLEHLAGLGVEPTRFKLRLSLGGEGAGRAAAGSAGSDHAERPQSARAMAGAALQRLGVGEPDMAGEAPAEVMARLLAVLLSRATLTDGARDMIRRLHRPARRLAAEESEIWRSPDHPLWQLLDRLVTAGSVHDGFDTTTPGRIGAALESAVRRLEEADPPDADHCREALAAVDFAATDQLCEQVEWVTPQAERMDEQRSRDDIEARLREQIVQQVRASAVPAALRQFLVGPWASALAHSACTHGNDSAQVRTQAELVDDMIGACCRAPGQPLASKVFTRCITHARLGLQEAAFPAARIEAELADLEQVLRKPWAEAATASVAAEPVAIDAAAQPLPFLPTEPIDLRQALGLHEALPTVPIDMDGADGRPAPGPAQGAADAWLDGLETGMVCRMFILERWMNTQLVWRNSKRTMFVFASRHAGRSHSLSRSALRRLRAAGLAATIEKGHFVAQALSELAGSPAD